MIRPCLLIPVYNHGTFIRSTFERVRQFGLPCLLVDDGSEPDTADTLLQLAAQEPSITLIRLTHNSGKGAAVICGLRTALKLGYSHALQMDADGQHNTDDIPAMLEMAEKEPTALISGMPVYGDDIPVSRLYGRYITHFWVWIETLSFDIRDSMCGFRVYPVNSSCQLAERTRLGQRMDFDTEIMVRLYWAGTAMRFLPTRVVYPADGISHFRVLRDNLSLSWMHTRLVCEMLCQLPHLLRNKRRLHVAEHRETHWSRQREQGNAWGLRFCLGCYRILGQRALTLLLYPIICWFFICATTARKASRQYLNKVLDHQATPADSFRHFMSFGRSLIDKLAAWNGKIRHTDILFNNRDLLLHQKTSGKGCVILTSHLGNTDVCRALAGYVPDLHLNTLLFTHHAENINRVLKEVNPGSQMEIIQIDTVGPDTAILLHNKVQDGEFVVIAADRTSPTSMSRISSVDFLGHPALFPQGPFILASLLECPVYLLFAIHNGQQYEIFVEHFSDRLSFPRRQRTALLTEVIQRYAGRLEHYCRRAPLQWFNFFDFWQAAPHSARANTVPGLPDD